MKAIAVIGPKEPPIGRRKAVVELDGKPVGFWLDPDDHPWIEPGSPHFVEFDPQDQFAKIAVGFGVIRGGYRPRAPRKLARWTIDLVNPQTNERKHTLCRFDTKEQAEIYCRYESSIEALKVGWPGFIAVPVPRAFTRKKKKPSS